MSFEALQFENGQGREESVEGAFIPLTQKRVVITLRPGMSGKIPETPGSPETPVKPGYSGLPRSAPKKITS
jgi:hypothetical protein